jgi:hypothetical protein
MRPTRYGRHEADAMTGRRIVGEGEIRGLCAGIAADLAPVAVKSFLAGELFELEAYQAHKRGLPEPNGAEWRAGFEHGMTRALVRLFYTMPLPKWRDAVRKLGEEVRREAEMSRRSTIYKDDGTLPF